jgi:CRP/FNR family cyclic AMP-dependent transcriptional regulator
LYNDIRSGNVGFVALGGAYMVALKEVSQVPAFSGLGPQELQEVVGYFRERTLAPGEVAVWEGEACDAVFFLVRGLARVRRMSAEGREQVLSYLAPGDAFNLVPALDGGLNPATVEAVTESLVLATTCGQFQLILHAYPQVAQMVLKQFAHEIRGLADMVEQLALHTVRTRLARFLLDSTASPSPPQGWTQEEIAARIGTVREMVGRTLRAFADEGLIRRRRGRIVIADPRSLEREAAH